MAQCVQAGMSARGQCPARISDRSFDRRSLIPIDERKSEMGA
jgi:hypothetical protein